MTDHKKPESKKTNSNIKKVDIKNMGIDIDKNEYQEIVLSNSNLPDRTYYEREY